LALSATAAQATDPLPSWNDGTAKQSIVAVVEKATTPGSPDYVRVPERIAVFDDDGTLWCEQPAPVQFDFVIDRVKALAPQHPEWKNQELFAVPPAGAAVYELGPYGPAAKKLKEWDLRP
jgi:hypothetical protein